MYPAVFSSVSFTAMSSALDGLALRHRVVADNVANLQTPGFLAAASPSRSRSPRPSAAGRAR